MNFRIKNHRLIAVYVCIVFFSPVQVFVSVTELADVKCSGNWMWAAKLPGEGAKMFDACKAMCKMMSELNIAIDGGKDSLSMAARVKTQTVKSPGKLQTFLHEILTLTFSCRNFGDFNVRTLSRCHSSSNT